MRRQAACSFPALISNSLINQKVNTVSIANRQGTRSSLSVQSEERHRPWARPGPPVHLDQIGGERRGVPAAGYKVW